MKKSLFFSLALASFVLVGCSQKAPEVEPVVINKNTPVSVESSSTSSIPPDAIDGGSIDSDINSMQSVDVESSSVGSSVNSIDIEPIYFAFNRYVVSDRELDKIDADARIINSKNPTSIKLEGNCDEWGTDEYNYALGLKRAKSVKEALRASGVKVPMNVVSYGESKPVCTEHNDACWQRNRRVDIKVY